MNRPASATVQLLTLVAVSVGFYGLTVVPLWLAGRENVLTHGSAALVVCLVPAAVTLLISLWLRRRSPEEQALAVVLGVGVRVVAVLVGGLYLQKGLPAEWTAAEFKDPFGGALAGVRAGLNAPSDRDFWVWVIAFYLFTLAAEVVLLASGRPAERPTAVP